MTTVVLACLALAAPQQASPHRQFLDKLATATFLRFHVERTTILQSLPDDPRVVNRLSGTMTLAKDGRWLWEREDGWAQFFDGKQGYKTDVGSDWYEETDIVDTQGHEITKEHLEDLLLGLDPFFQRAWKGVRGREDWWGAGKADWPDQDVVMLVRPKSADQVRDARDGSTAAGVWLYVDAKTLRPLLAETWDSSSQDRSEEHAKYSNFEFDPPGADALLTKKGG
jgi:hypothetical protein